MGQSFSSKKFTKLYNLLLQKTIDTYTFYETK